MDNEVRLINANTLKEFINEGRVCDICPNKKFNCVYNCDFPDYLTPLWEKVIDSIPPIEDTPVYRFWKQAYERGKAEGITQDAWIPVSERLPDLWEVVLVTDEFGNVFEYERRELNEEGNVCRAWCFLNRKIIAWMPLPEPYKEEENEFSQN